MEVIGMKESCSSPSFYVDCVVSVFGICRIRVDTEVHLLPQQGLALYSCTVQNSNDISKKTKKYDVHPSILWNI